MINPDMTRPENGYGVTIGHSPPAIMSWRAPDHGIASGLAVMDVKTMNNNVGDVLNGDASSICNVDIGTAAVDGLEAVHDQLLLQHYDHVPLEDNPERLVLDHSMAQGAWPWVDRVVIARVGDDIESAIAATNGIATKADAAVGQALAILVPVAIAPPTVINWIPSSTREIT